MNLKKLIILLVLVLWGTQSRGENEVDSKSGRNSKFRSETSHLKKECEERRGRWMGGNCKELSEIEAEERLVKWERCEKEGGYLDLVGWCVKRSMAGDEKITDSSNEKKLLYISWLNFSQGIPGGIKNSLYNQIKLNLLERYGDKYEILSHGDYDSDYRIAYFNRIIDKWRLQGYSDEQCRIQIVDAINPEEVIYGAVLYESGKVILSLKNFFLDKKTLEIKPKSSVEINFTENEYDHYIIEATIKLIEPAYQIKPKTRSLGDLINE